MPFQLVCCSTIGLGLGILFLVGGFIMWKQKRLIENTPTSKIRSLAMGFVEIHGKAEPEGDLLESPLEKKKCVYYKYKIEEYRSSGKSGRWVTIASGGSTNPFYLRDNTGKVLVDPKGAKMDLPHSFSIQSGTFKDPPKNIQDFLKKIALNHESFLGFNKKMKYTEWVVAKNDSLYIIGNADDNPHVKEASGQQNVDDIMIQKGSMPGSFYYISNKVEKDILCGFTWKIFFGLFGGALTIIISLIIILLSIMV